MAILRRNVTGINVKETQIWNKVSLFLSVYDLVNNIVICSDDTDRID